MIKVYLYVVGLVLYQFTPDPNGLARLLFPAGGYGYPGLIDASIHPHHLKIYSRELGHETLLPITATIAAPCPPQTSCAMLPPQFILDLADVVPDPVVRPECLDMGTVAGCRTAAGSPALNGLIELRGRWKTASVTDCGGEYPAGDEKVALVNFVRQNRAWEVRFTEAAEWNTRNGVIFTTSIADLDELSVPSSLAGHFAVYEAASGRCDGFPDFHPDLHTGGCVALVLRNGPDPLIHPDYGGASLHFATLYTLLEQAPTTTEMWLPISVGAPVCPGGTGSNGMHLCQGAMVIAP